MADVIYHLTTPEAWTEAQRTGSYLRSTRDASLAEVGFVHCSERDQVARTLTAFYADLDEVVLLGVEEAGLDVRRERSDGQLFPHVYGPIPLASVVSARSFAPGQPLPV